MNLLRSQLITGCPELFGRKFRQVRSTLENVNSRNVESAVKRIAERHRLEAESLALQAQFESPPSSPKRTSTPQAFLDRTSRLALPASDRDRPELLGPTRDLLVSGSGKVVGAVKKPLKGLGSLVFGEGGESPPERAGGSSAKLTPASPAAAAAAGEEQAREREEEAAVRLANAEIERAETAEREQRGQTLEMLTQMFPGILSSWLSVDLYVRFGSRSC